MKSLKRKSSPNKHKMRERSGTYPSVSKIVKQRKEETIAESRYKVRILEPDKEDSEFECYNKTEGKPVHFNAETEQQSEKNHRHRHYYRKSRKIKKSSKMLRMGMPQWLKFVKYRNLIVSLNGHTV